MSNIKLRDYQEKGAFEIREAFRTSDCVVYVLSTGGGKTYLFCYIADSASKKSRRVMIIVHRKELLLQASKSLRALGIDHGLISPHFTPAPHKLVQVASVDTLAIRLKKKPMQVDLLIYDEGHHVTESNKWGRVYDALGRPKTLLVTATPVRTDGVGLGVGHGGIAQDMVLGPPIAELIERGMLINPTVYTSLQAPDLTGLKKNKDGDYNSRDLEEIVDKPVITGNAVQHFRDICPGARAVIFCTSIKHAKHVVDEFNAAGFRFRLLVGSPEMSDAERTEVIRELAAGEITGVVSVDLVSEGFDIPGLECCIMLRPTQSESLYLQQAGRVMRPAEGKTQCWLLDHVGNVGRQTGGKFVRKHGLPSDHREWSLEGRKKRSKKDEDETIRMDQCPKCYHVHEPAPACPQCGHVEPKANTRELEQVDGKLQQVTAEMEAVIKKGQRAAQGQAQTVEEMVTELGYNRQRALAIVKARQEKQAMREALRTGLVEWNRTTGQAPFDVLGIHLSQINSFKPAELKALQARLDEHKRVHNTAAAVDVFRAHAGATNQDLQF